MNTKSTLQPAILTTADAARYLSLATVTLEVWRQQKRGPAYVRLGRRIAYRVRDLESFLDRQTQLSASAQ